MAHLKRNLADLSSSDSDNDDTPLKTVETQFVEKFATPVANNGVKKTLVSGESHRKPSALTNGSVRNGIKQSSTSQNLTSAKADAKSKSSAPVASAPAASAPAKATAPAKAPAPAAASHWSQGLIGSMNDPSLLLSEDDSTVIIKDKYPKAKHHYLIMPKDVSVRSLHVLSLSKHSDLFNHIKR